MEEQPTKGKRILKRVGYVVGALVIFFIGSAVGTSGAKTMIDDKKVSMEQLEKKMDELTDKKMALSNDINSLTKEKDEVQKLINSKDKVKSELADMEAKLKDTKGTLDQELKDGRKDIEEKLKKAKDELADAQARVKEVQAEINSKKKELASVTGQVKKAKGQPKVLQAGTYTVGKDIPEGRYKATPVGQGSNFVTFDDGGTPDVNTILGSYGQPSYTFEVYDGYSIQTEATVKLTPVE